MNDVNIVIMSGRLTRDSVDKEYGNSTKHSFGLAVNKNKKVGEEWKEEANFFDVECWNKGNLAQYFTKGRRVLVEGELDASRYEKDGKTVTRNFIKAENIQILDFGKSEGTAKAETTTSYNNAHAHTPNYTKPTVTPETFEDNDTDIPF